jgi:hypothetical protein
MKMKNGYNYDAISNTVTISASFAKKASKVGSEEYEIMLKLRKDNPNLKVMKEEKTGNAQLTYKKMEEFIGMHRNKDELLKAFKGAKTLSKFHSMPYTFVKNWFTKTFPYFEGGNYMTDADGYIVETPAEKKEESSESESQKAPHAETSSTAEITNSEKAA